MHLQSAGQGADLAPLVNFYSKLPKGPAPASKSRGIKARYFNGANASASPIVAVIFGLFTFGYILDYQSASPAASFPHIRLTFVSSLFILVVHLSKCRRSLEANHVN